MEHLPPVTWRDVATNHALDASKETLHAEIAATKAEIAATRAELKAEIADLRTELKTEIADLRVELQRRARGDPHGRHLRSVVL